ncbi:MAG: bifunctional diaminohydroxyphosphoribosylaminopyrimidine deaminase/5-amino-6-(5-phosphoribosylamino)uracil reductase RibD [Candidatus Sumerlaeia bacterium]|nr:bifunctional diaminohydroxyphosphoribosylaminopyrimidine deaminase/5-amino-6-(5-phosphoribosylamino)uracil reductase RibD [Candidatus Sumerlaeia bacterium]
MTGAGERWMERAMALALRARGATWPNPCVGCVIVRGDEVLGEGWHTRAGAPHAEIEALADAARQARDVRGATAYVTLEPCNHTGRTGPCSEALLAAAVARVAVGAADPNPKATGGAVRLRAAGVEVLDGVLAERCRRLNPWFHARHALGRPSVTLKWAATLDGAVSTESGDSKWITSEAARADAHRERAAHHAVVCGVGTLLADAARLSPRGVPLEAHGAPARIVLDTWLRTPPDAPFVQEPVGRAIVACGTGADPAREAALRRAGAELWRLPTGPRGVDLAALCARCLAEDLPSLFVEGGRQVLGAFIEARLADRVRAYLAPRILGGHGAHLGPVALAREPQRIAEALDLRDATVESVGGCFVVEGWLAD